MKKTSEYNARWRKRHRKQYNDIMRAYHRRVYPKIRRDILAKRQAETQAITQFSQFLKEDNPCTDCGKYDIHYTMEWDHVLPKLHGSPSSARTWKQMDKELARCELVCSRCHKIRTWNRAKT